MTTNGRKFRRLEINGGHVVGKRPFPHTPLKLQLPTCPTGYTDAQIDDYGGRRRAAYSWQRGTHLQLTARFSHEADNLVGTAGFGFWNAPFGDPTLPWPALPQATWFFFGSPPNDLPLANKGAGRGWYAATLDATRWQAISLLPLAPPVLLLNQFGALRQKVWPWVQNRLQISFQPIAETMADWHEYQLDWRESGCDFWLDGRLIHHTPFSPRGPLGFVCWIDNQFMVAKPNGRLRWGTLPIKTPQFLELSSLHIESI
ncbi:FIG01021316: hypothetical protein [hydrothermal vent metagenome]|uniref:GH16 domain-containing protein n=1 Tax=hydrothermal vent metagenome TaxID=652676 RepID=A0A3B0V221_9ZZZZ